MPRDDDAPRVAAVATPSEGLGLGRRGSYRGVVIVSAPTHGKHLHACPVAVAAWLDEHGGRGLKSDSTLSNWRRGKNAVTHRALQLRLVDLELKQVPSQIEDLVQRDSGPGKRWMLCCHFDGGQEIVHCPNRGDEAPVPNASTMGVGDSGPASDPATAAVGMGFSGPASDAPMATVGAGTSGPASDPATAAVGAGTSGLAPDPRMATAGAGDSGPTRDPASVAPPAAASADAFSEYRTNTRLLHQHLRLVGFDERVRVAIGLEDLHVPLDVVLDHGPMGRMIYSDAHHAEKHTEHYARCERMTMATAFGRAEKAGKHGLALLGDPGSGKTTQLRRLVLQLLSKSEGGGPEAVGLPPQMLPVFLPLRDHQGETKLVDFMQRVLDGPLGDAPPGLAKRLIDRGHLLLVFDGLDEVADETQRDQVARWIETLLNHAPNCRFIVSSRYAGYTPTIKLDSAFLELHLRPLTDDQAEQFVRNWYDVVETAEAELDGEEPEPGRATELLEDLRELENRGEAQLYAMTRNPMLLTALCLVHRRRQGALPADRGALYRECTAVLLERKRRRGLAGPDRLSAGRARLALQPAALWMHDEVGRRQASGVELVPSVQAGLARVEQPRPTAERFLRRIRDESGLLTGWGLDRYGFMHLGFQEYLSALEVRHLLATSPDDGGGIVLDVLAEQFDQTWWQEVILLALANDDPGLTVSLMQVLAERPDFEGRTASSLMSRVVALCTEGVRQQLDGMLLRHRSPEVCVWWRRHRGLDKLSRETVVAPRGGVELVRIPGGSFLMGSPDDEEGHLDNEGPQRRVELSDFYLAATPVTNAQYGEYLKARPDVEKPQYWGDAEYNQPQQPVVGVSWEEAQAYCEWAGLRLPTEAQWEYACRAGTTTRYHSGDTEEDLARAGWYDGNSDDRLHSVGQKEANAFGLYDMHGNVEEWCAENWTGSYEDAVHQPGDGLRTEPVGYANRVLRGGYFINSARHARSAYRSNGKPDYRYDLVGFRPAQGHPLPS